MKKIIEFFGVSGSGKTKLKNKLNLQDSYDYRSLIYYYSGKYFVLNKDEEKSLLYFRIIKSSFVKKIKYFLKSEKNWKNLTSKKIEKKENSNNKYFNNYKKIVSKIFQKTKKKNQAFSKFVLNIISNLKCSRKFKKLMELWFKEEFSSYYLSKKIQNKILIDSEGFVQRLIIYLYFTEKSKHKAIIKKYLNLMPKIDTLIIVNFDKTSISKKKLDLPDRISLKKQIEIFLNIQKIILDKKTKKKITKIIKINPKTNFKKILI